MISGIILAGGESSRIKYPKALLSIKSETFAESIVNKMKRSGVGPVLLVTGADHQEIKDTLEERIQAELVYNEQFAEGQISSLKAGLRSIPSNSVGVLVWPVDLPLVMEQTAFRILAAFLANSKSIVVPVLHTRRGHPVFYGKNVIESILSLPAGENAKNILRHHHKDILEIEVDDPGILIDIDTPEDYANYVLR